MNLFPLTQYLTNETSVGSELYGNNERQNTFSSPVIISDLLTLNDARGTGPLSNTDIRSARIQTLSGKKVSTTENGNDSRLNHNSH